MLLMTLDLFKALDDDELEMGGLSDTLVFITANSLLRRIGSYGNLTSRFLE